MTHRKGAVWTERLVLALILASLAGTLNLVLVIHRRVQSTAIVSKTPNIPPPSPPAASKTLQVARPAAAPPSIPRKSESPPVTPKPPPDPTAPILARIDGAIAREAEAAREADRRAEAMEKARQASVAESQRWKRREMLVRQQVAALSQRADKLEQDALTLDAERDVLARERDALKAALTRGGQRSGYSVLPYKGPNGTWRRPIVLECSANRVKLQPNGPTFSMLELSPLIHPRSSPVILAIAREMMKVQRAETPDGAPAVPYLVFLVRPDGIRPYYQARGRLEPLGIAFGYELIEQDLAVDIPDFDDVRTWDGTIPLDIAGGDAKHGGNGSPRVELPRGDDSRESATWPGGDRPATADASGPGTWPPTGDSPGKPGSDRRWPDLARGDGPGRGMSGGAGASGRGSDEAPAPEIDLGGKPGRGDGSDGRGPGGSGGGSPDDFVWPTTSGGTSPTGSQGTGRAMGRTSADGAGMGSGFDGTTPGGMTGRGSARSSDSPSSAGGWPGSDRMGRDQGSPGQGSQSGSRDIGEPPGAPEAGRPLARPADSGRANVSTPGAGAGRGSRPSGGGGATGSGGGNPDKLPELEPVRGGSSTFGTPMPGGGGSGGSGSGRSGPPPSAPMGGSSPGASRGAGKPSSSTTGQPGNATASAIPGGPDAPDRGFVPYAAGADSPGQGGPGSGSSASAPAPTTDGAGTPGAPGSAPTLDMGQDVGVGGGLAGAAESSESNGPSKAASRGSSTGSSSAMNSGLPASGTGSTSGSTPPQGWGSISGSAASSDAGRPPTPLQAATVPRSSPSSSAGAFGGSLSDLTEFSSGGASGSMGSASGSSSASSSGAASSQPGGQPPSGMPAFASGMSLPSLNTSPDPDSEPDALKGLALPPIETHRQPGAIDVPFEIVVVCRRDDLLLHPGGYRITTQSLQAGAAKGDTSETMLQRELKTMVRRRAQVDPLIRPKPRLKFLVEAGGASTFWKARRQLTFSNLDWPMTVEVAGPQTGYLLDERIRR